MDLPKTFPPYSILTATLCALLTLSVSAQAQTGWSGTVVDLSPPSVDASDSVLAVDAAGNAIALWIGNSGEVIQAARFSRTSGTWSAPVALSASGVNVEDPSVAFDPAGNAIATWLGHPGAIGIDGVVQTARYSIATNTWSAATDVPGANEAIFPDVVIDSAGDATVVWYGDEVSHFILRSARYTAATGSWGSVLDIGDTGNEASTGGERLVVDGDGSVTVVWTFVLPSSPPSTSQWTVRAARYVPASGTWTVASDLASALGLSENARIRVDGAGNVMAIWPQFDGPNYRLRFARFTIASNAWSAAANIPGVAANVEDAPALAVEPNGDAMVVSSQRVGSDDRVQAIRYSAATGTWSGVATLSAAGRDGNESEVAVDAAGNAIVIWNRFDGTAQIIQAAYYTRATDTWSTPTDLSATGEDAGDSRVAFDAAGNAIATWERGTGILDVVQATRWLAAPSATPTNLRASSIVGNTVTIAWDAPSAGGTPTEYVLEGGILPGQVLASVPTGSAATTLTFIAPSGVFYIRTHALVGTTRSAASNEIRIAVNVPTPPSAPVNLAGQANGSSLSLTWQNTAGGGTPTAITLEVTGSLTTSVTLPASESFAYAGVPNGTYTFVVRASNASGVSAPSNPVTLTFTGFITCTPPGVGVPTNFVASKSGNLVSVSWAPPATGPAPTSYTLLVTGSFVGSFSTPGLTLAGPAPPGSYTVSVFATNACGRGPATPPQTVVIP